MSAALDAAAALAIAGAVLAMTAIVIGVLRCESGTAARHAANLALPCVLLPLLVALLLLGPRSALGTGVLVALVQLVSGAAESHVTARLALLERWKRSERGAPAQSSGK